MHGNADIQVWLETSARTTPSVVTPYVQSAVNKTLQYRVRAVKEGRSGKSAISQSGTVATTAQKPAALGQMSMNVGPGDQCRIELVLIERGAPDRTYQFDCP